MPFKQGTLENGIVIKQQYIEGTLMTFLYNCSQYHHRHFYVLCESRKHVKEVMSVRPDESGNWDLH
jgi:hypothetical protein